MAGRPSKYKPEFAEQAYNLCLMGLTDDQVAFFFGITIEDMAMWAWHNESFYNAITPTEAQRQAYRDKILARRTKRAEQRLKRIASNPSERLAESLRSRMWAVLKGKRRASISELPYTIKELVEHLESRFQPGMGWHNYGSWHVDHIKPCALFDLTDPVQFRQCWALSNLQPLWAADNIRKGAKYAGV